MASDQWNGLPENPERDGWHWLEWTAGREPSFWSAHDEAWHSSGELMGPRWVSPQARYLGPCILPADLAARIQAEREAVREVCRKAALLAPVPEEFVGQSLTAHTFGQMAAAAAIHALDLGPTDALAQVKTAARAAGMEARREVIAALEIAAELPSSNRCQAFVKAFVEEAPWALADVQKHLAAIKEQGA